MSKQPAARFLPLLFIVLALTACGGVVRNPVPAGQMDEAPAQSAQPSAAEPESEQVTLATGAESADYDGVLVPVGFTAEGRPYRGSLNAPVVLEEFSDFQCPYCGRFTAQTMPELVKNQIAAGQVLLIYYDFPLENIHPQAFAAANAARCAGEQGAISYWAMHDLLYERMNEWSGGNPDAAFVAFSAELGLEQAQFESCVSDLKYEDKVNADIDLALSRGVRSTPSFFLNDQPLIGAQPIAAFNEAITMVMGGESIAETQPQQQTAQSPLQPPAQKPEPADIDLETYAATLGNPDAPVTIVEYTDYQCPFCQRYSQETLPTLISEKIDAGEVFYILKDLPLDNIHPNARDAAIAARCAGEQDAYWQMHDALFDSQEGWGSNQDLPAEMFVDLAASLDLNRDAFAACLDQSSSFADEVQTNVDEALRLGVNSTPSFFINGYPVSGAQPYELFDYAVSLAKEGTLADAYVPPAVEIADAHAVGDPNAPVTIIEFTDFQCPFCSRHYEQTYGRIKEKYVDSGQVYYVFKDFPLTNIHPQATIAAVAARCAGEQDAYAAMHGKLFSEQSAWSGSGDAGEVFRRFAREIGIEGIAFSECLESGRFEAAVIADQQEGAQRGINGTPAFVINGYSMSGAQPYAVFEEAIESFLNDAG